MASEKPKMTEAQKQRYKMMPFDRWVQPYEIGAQEPTMIALVNAGLVERSYNVFLEKHVYLKRKDAP